MEYVDNQGARRLRVVQIFRGEPLSEKSFALETVSGLRRRSTVVSIGQDGADTFTIPVCPLPPSFPLLRAVGEEFVLTVSDGMHGELHLDGKHSTVKEFFEGGRGITASSSFAMANLREHVLSDKDWGIVATEPSGTVAFYFELLDPPSESTDLRPKGRLAAFRGIPLFADRFILQALGISAVFHLVVVILAFLAWEPPPPLSIEPRVAERYLRAFASVGLPLSARPSAKDHTFAGTAHRLWLDRERRLRQPIPLLSDEPGQSTPGAKPLKVETPVPVPTKPEPAPAPQPPVPQPPAVTPEPAIKAEPPATKPEPPATKPEPPATKPEPPATKPEPPKPAPTTAKPALAVKPAPPAAKPAPPAAKPAPPAAKPTPPPAKPTGKTPNLYLQSGAPRSASGVMLAAVDRVIASHQLEVDACLRKELQIRPFPTGKLTLVWSHDATGTVTSAKIESATVQSQTLSTCIVQKVLKWRFPASKGMIQGATVPFVFRVTP